MEKIAVILMSLMMLMSSNFAQAESGYELKPVTKDNPDYIVIKKWANGFQQVKVNKLSEVSSPILRKLFLEYRFYRISWATKKSIFDLKNEVEPASGLDVILSINQNTKDILAHSYSDDYVAYGTLLNKAKIKIISTADAELVWEAFCDLYHLLKEESEYTKISPTKWHIGKTVSNKISFYYEINVDDKGVVLDGIYTSSGKEYEYELKPVSIENADYSILTDSLKKLPAEDEKYYELTYDEWREVTSPILQKQFPDHRFYRIDWYLRATKLGIKKGVSVPFSLYAILSVEQNSKNVIEHSGYGNYLSYGTLLNNAKVKISSTEDAQLVWEAFCEMYQKHWKDHREHKQISPTKWHIGISVSNNRMYFYEVNLDKNGIVLDARLNSKEL